jgi:glycosyltransferase involved in cell wall biosynthesis
MGGSVSIVIPTRNRGRLLPEAVRSAVAARPAEVIVADGGSTDGSLGLLAGFDAPVTVLHGNWPNAAATRNAGAVAARGDYLGFLDSDDIALPAKVASLAAVLDADRNLALVHGRVIVIDAAGVEDAEATATYEEAFRRGEDLGTSYDALARFCAMFTSATLIRRSSFESIGGYDESLDAYEDWDLYLRLSIAQRLAYDPRVVAKHRVWAGNVTWEKTAEWTARVAEKHLASLPELPPEAHKAARFGFLARIAASRHVLVQRRATRRAALGALRASPLAAVRTPEVRDSLFASLLPESLLRRRRPSSSAAA